MSPKGGFWGSCCCPFLLQSALTPFLWEPSYSGALLSQVLISEGSLSSSLQHFRDWRWGAGGDCGAGCASGAVGVPKSQCQQDPEVPQEAEVNQTPARGAWALGGSAPVPGVALGGTCWGPLWTTSVPSCSCRAPAPSPGLLSTGPAVLGSLCIPCTGPAALGSFLPSSPAQPSPTRPSSAQPSPGLCAQGLRGRRGTVPLYTPAGTGRKRVCE